MTEARAVFAEALVVELRVDLEAGTRAEDLLRAEVIMIAILHWILAPSWLILSFETAYVSYLFRPSIRCLCTQTTVLVPY